VLDAYKSWLKHSSEPWAKVLELWDVTATLRFQEFRGVETSIAQTLKEWPRYKDPYGYSLVSFQLWRSLGRKTLVTYSSPIVCSMNDPNNV
jgi:hypothetical protein